MDRRTLVKQEIQKLRRVLDILDAGSPRTGRQPKANTKRTISAAGRKRIAAAQKARWAKIRAGKK
jgi:hypothetical protein